MSDGTQALTSLSVIQVNNHGTQPSLAQIHGLTEILLLQLGLMTVLVHRGNVLGSLSSEDQKLLLKIISNVEAGLAQKPSSADLPKAVLQITADIRAKLEQRTRSPNDA
jgi:hypothetical protein